MANEPRSSNQVYFDPDEHPEDTLKSFDEFIKVFGLRYDAQYPDPPKVSLESAIERWKISHTTETVPNPKPSLEEYDKICLEWRSKDKVIKLLGMFSSHKLYEDWCIAEPDETKRGKAHWDDFVAALKAYYKPTENHTLKHFHFRSITQQPEESFPRFCNRVESEAKHCNFMCESERCTAQEVAVRDQILIGTTESAIRDEALKQAWSLKDLRQEGMKMESAARSGAQISGENCLNKIGKYSFDNIKSAEKRNEYAKQKTLTCYNCGTKVTGSIIKHKRICAAKSHNCKKCSKTGHFDSVCKSKPVQKVDTQDQEVADNDQDEGEDTYSVDIFRISSSKDSPKPHLKSNKNDFSVRLMINNHLDRVIADTGARISVCGTTQAKKWGLLGKMYPSKIKIKPYNSNPIKVHGEARCAVTYGSTSVPVVWHIISGDCEPILSGNSSLQLGIIEFKKPEETFQPILMIESVEKEELQNILARYPQNFHGLGKLKNYQTKLHVNKDIKPVNVPAHSFPYHLQARAQAEIDEMIRNDVIEEHPANEPAPWVSNAVLSPKQDGSIRVTMNAKNVNKALISSNIPIPKQEDIKTKLAGAKVFSKMDLKSAFWQVELEKESRYLTVFHANDKLYRYKRLTMGLSPSQGELTVALRPVFAHIRDVHIIHDDLIIAAKNHKEHNQAVLECMEAIAKAGLTLNGPKCVFGKKEIGFWGMMFGSYGVKPDSAKVEALEYITPPTSKEELISYLCMMQSNSDFIPNFAQISAPLRELTKARVHFKWKEKHQKCFNDLIKAFKQDTLLRYFDLTKPTYIFTDAHISGFGAMLAQGEDMASAKPVAFASRTTNKAESNYPQLDLEAMGVDFGLRRFRKYIVGAPDIIKVVTDHKPLCGIFNGSRSGSIRTEKIKMRHQDIRYEVVFQQGKLNQTDFISRRGKPLERIPRDEQDEVNDVNNLLYMLHVTPVLDKINIGTISLETQHDSTLKRVLEIVEKGQTWISKNEPPAVQRFREILPEITVTGNKILLKAERIILPESLHDTAIQLAHRGSHPGQSGIERRIRYHFFFHDLQKKVQGYLQNCSACLSFTDKKMAESIQSHKVPSKCWETVAVDLFGPMPSKNHVVVVQDIASRFPAAKLVSSTSAKHVLPALANIYNDYGNPDIQISDNGTPFNSKEMEKLANDRNITLKKIPPHHPQANPAETFMKPLGKAMKIAHQKGQSEKEALQCLLSNHRDTPHPATGVPPGSMLFRDGYQTVFPRKCISEEDAGKARKRDQDLKSERDRKINASKYHKDTNIEIGDTVIIRQHDRRSKFDPLFPLELHNVIAQEGKVVTVKRQKDGKIFKRHPDDLKVTSWRPFEKPTESNMSEREQLQKFHQLFDSIKDTENDSGLHLFEEKATPTPVNTDDNEILTFNPRRSTRAHKPNPRYFNPMVENR